MQSRVVWLSACAALTACSLLTDLSSLGSDGGGSATLDGGAGDAMDAPPDAPPDGFVLTIAPAHLTMDLGDSFPVHVTITRGAQFNGLVNVGVNGAPTGVAVTPLTILAGQTTGTFNVSLSAAPPQADFSMTVFGASSGGNETSSAPLGVHYGSLLVDTTTDRSLTVPPFATALLVKAWGAGGGGGDGLMQSIGNGYVNVYVGGTGGGGGFASGTIAVTPNETLQLDVGGSGPAPGGGGGFSGLFRATTPLLVAGGGGGGSSAWAPCSQAGKNGYSGAAGGGADGQTRANAAGPGTQTHGGAGSDASAGSYLQGGSGDLTAKGAAAAHGGGRAGAADCSGGGGAGGGGGYYGGAGGSYHGSVGYGGGGGSGFVEATATAPQLVTGAGTAAASANDLDRADAGTGGSAGGADCNPACTKLDPGVGHGGHVIVRLPKP